MEDSIWNTTERDLLENHPTLPPTLSASYLLIHGIVAPNFEAEPSVNIVKIDNPFRIPKPFTTFQNVLWYFISASSTIEAGSRTMESITLEQLNNQLTLRNDVCFSEPAYFKKMVRGYYRGEDPFLLYYNEKPHSFKIFSGNCGLEFTMDSDENTVAFGINGMGVNSVHHQLEASFTFEPEVHRFGLSRDGFDETGRSVSEQKYERFLTDSEKDTIKDIWKVSSGKEIATYPN
ncbi:MAG: hypothetical protein QG570_581 [Patescibacteria group bacterium]|nr:hypothetical protein [Patescibacteria group bacterium]